MSIWFYLFIILLIVNIILLMIIINFKRTLRDIINDIDFITNMDTNKLITVNSSDKDIQKFVCALNKKLKNLRKLELDYKNGNLNIKHFLANISHDLRTPLTILRGYLDIIKFDNLDIKQREYLDIINKKTDDLIILTEELFSNFKALDKIDDIMRKDICLNEVLEDVICSFYPLFKKYGITPNVKICKKKVIRKVDSNCLNRILENILSNALKYGKDDMNITLEYDGKIIISNKTSKLNKLAVEKLFDRYFTVQDGKSANGIGLGITKELVELNGGTIMANYRNMVLYMEVYFK